MLGSTSKEDLVELPLLHVGAPIARQALTLFPVWTEHPEGPSPFALPDASSLHVRELEQAQVPSMLAVNTGVSPLLLLQGEVIEGGLQTRVVGVSLLLPAGETVIPVSCVEAGRWSGGRDARRAERTVLPSVRAAAVRGVNRLGARDGTWQADQGQVWSEVAGTAARLGAVDASRTGSHLEHLAALDGSVERLVDGLHPLPGQRGLVVGIGGKVVALELLHSARAFAARFDSLVRSYAAESLGAPAKATSSSAARWFVRDVAGAPAQHRPSPGLGEQVRFDSQAVTGAALTCAPLGIVHLAAFPAA
jgi:hypothetical protein